MILNDYENGFNPSPGWDELDEQFNDECLRADEKNDIQKLNDEQNQNEHGN